MFSVRIDFQVLERHITRQQIYLDQIAKGVERTYEALNGEQVRFRRNTERCELN